MMCRFDKTAMAFCCRLTPLMLSSSRSAIVGERHTSPADFCCAVRHWTIRCFSKDVGKKFPTKEESSKEAKASSSPTVMLLGWDNSRIGVMTFKDALKLAKQKDLKLVQIEDTSKSLQLQVYKLMTGVQLHEERMKIRESKQSDGEQMNLSKDEKTLIVGGKISEHDRKVRIKTIQKWLSKGYIIKVTINGDKSTTGNLEKIFSEMEKAADEVGGQALQKRSHGEQGHSMKFTLQMSRKKLDARKMESQAKDVPDDVDNKST